MKCNFTVHLEISWHDFFYFCSFVNKKQFIGKNINLLTECDELIN